MEIEASAGPGNGPAAAVLTFLRRRGLALAGALACCALFGASSAPAAAQGRVDVESFYDDLAPYGTWVRSSEYGDVWFPRGVSASWQPYSDGRWVWTDEYGWYWESERPWGWAVFHYGRWYQDPRYGWGWVPDSQWGPGWVAWRSGGGYMGWAPLPPSARFEMGYDDRDQLLDVSIEPRHWLFVEERSFNAPRAYEVAVARHRNPWIVRHTAPSTYYRTRDHRVFNRGVPVERVETVIHAPVTRVHVQSGFVQDRHAFRSYEAERLRSRSVVSAPPAYAAPRERYAPVRREAPPAYVAPRARYQAPVRREAPPAYVAPRERYQAPPRREPSPAYVAPRERYQAPSRQPVPRHDAPQPARSYHRDDGGRHDDHDREHDRRPHVREAPSR